MAAVLPPDPVPSVGTFVEDALAAAPTGGYPLFGASVSSVPSGYPETVQSRMHLYYAGQYAIGMTGGNEEYAAELLSMIAVDVVSYLASIRKIVPPDMVVPNSRGKLRGRTLIVPGGLKARSAVIFMPQDYTQSEPYRATIDFGLDRHFNFSDLENIADLNGLDGPLEDIYKKFMLGRPDDIRDVLNIVQPEIIIARQPKMIPLSAPSPSIGVDNQSGVSTMGVFCHDAQGDFGVTACYHGTGGPGTQVTIDGVTATVKSSNNIQDLSFIPFSRHHFSSTVLVGRSGVRASAPGIDDAASFNGVTSGYVPTMVSSYDRGLLRKSSNLQLKLQTPPDTNGGDSGAALIINNEIVAFAFNKTAFGEKPAMSEWIWAANAMDSLQLTPCAP